MNINDVLSFIQTATPEELSEIKTSLRAQPILPTINTVCNDDILKLLEVFPRTTSKYKGYKYDITAVTLVRYVKDLTNCITANYILRHNNQGYKVWASDDKVNLSKVEYYRDTFHKITSFVTTLMTESGRCYNDDPNKSDHL